MREREEEKANTRRRRRSNSPHHPLEAQVKQDEDDDDDLGDNIQESYAKSLMDKHLGAAMQLRPANSRSGAGDDDDDDDQDGEGEKENGTPMGMDAQTRRHSTGTSRTSQSTTGWGNSAATTTSPWASTTRQSLGLVVGFE